MKPEKRHLIHELLDEQRDARRQATLLAGGRVLRRRRWRRAALRSFAGLTLLALAIFCLQQLVPRRPPSLTAVPSPSPPPVQSLSDAQLLALFPDTPVGLITLENGRKRLIFPRPGDAERFIKPL
jgi:hypothetical protein